MISELLSLGTLKSENRLVLAPMTTYSSDEAGIITAGELELLNSRSLDGFGIVMTAACYVHKTGHAFKGQWRCDTDDAIAPSLRPAADAIRSGGGKSVLQIHHGGRACSAKLCGQVLSASAIPAVRDGAETPAEMTPEQIFEVISAFGSAARRAEEAGFDGVEIHGANTYLLQQFVSPHSNRRTDEFGQNRLLFSKLVVEAVLESVSPGYPVGYRFSPEEVEVPGIRLPDTLKLIDLLCEYPLAWLHISLGDFQQTSLVDDFKEPTLELVLNHLDNRLPLIGVGKLTSRESIDECLQMGCAAAAIGKAAITDPKFASKVLNGESPILKFPKANAAKDLQIPEGLAQRILGAPGWFEVED